ncbi:hypothetical protein MHU86_6385 [Fragilaria crotonensis]|nr:hypothetical protein MHU86_6385 [Fragilaria crotonensis]
MPGSDCTIWRVKSIKCSRARFIQRGGSLQAGSYMPPGGGALGTGQTNAWATPQQNFMMPGLMQQQGQATQQAFLQAQQQQQQQALLQAQQQQQMLLQAQAQNSWKSSSKRKEAFKQQQQQQQQALMMQQQALMSQLMQPQFGLGQVNFCKRKADWISSLP